MKYGTCLLILGFGGCLVKAQSAQNVTASYVDRLVEEYRELDLEEAVGKVFSALEIRLPGQDEHGHDHSGHDHSGHDDHGDHDDHEGHDHSLAKRQDEGPDMCMDADELIEAFSLTSLDAEAFTAISPALVSIKALNLCEARVEEASSTRNLTMGQVWLWALLTNVGLAIISILGIAVIPLLRRNKALEFGVLNGLIALAVGVLVGDALIHIIPVVIGYAAAQDAQSEEHSHTGSILYSVLIFLGAYVFFIFDTAITSIGALKEALKKIALGSGRSRKAALGKNPRLINAAMMVLAADGLHNIADGFAIGAAFMASWQIGLSTALAILFHELPHELGDFAVLLKAGMTPIRAAVMNGICSLTALIGTIISILVIQSLPSTSIDPAVNGILSFVAGNFLYLAINVLMSQLIQAQEKHPEPNVAIKSAENGTNGTSNTTLESEDKHVHSMHPEYRPKWAPFLIHSCLLLGVVVMIIIALFGEGVAV